MTGASSSSLEAGRCACLLWGVVPLACSSELSSSVLEAWLAFCFFPFPLVWVKLVALTPLSLLNTLFCKAQFRWSCCMSSGWPPGQGCSGSYWLDLNVCSLSILWVYEICNLLLLKCGITRSFSRNLITSFCNSTFLKSALFSTIGEHWPRIIPKTWVFWFCRVANPSS
jgi:hypothetical protein